MDFFARRFFIGRGSRRRRGRSALIFSDRVLDQQGRRYRAAQTAYFVFLWLLVIGLAAGVALFEGAKL